MHAPTDAKARKALPLCTGVLDYFPDALLEVAEVSRLGNEQHNPGQPLHWAKEKSRDEADALARHLVDRGTRDVDGVRHSAKVAWRALAMLQREIERERGYDYDPTTDTWREIYVPESKVTRFVSAPPTISAEHDAIAKALDAKAGGTAPGQAADVMFACSDCAGLFSTGTSLDVHRAFRHPRALRRQGDLY